MPESSSSAAARRVDARSVAGVCAASIGQTRRLQPLEQRHVVGIAAEERLAEVDVGLDEAGQEIGAAGVDDVVARRVRFRADRHDASAVDGDRALDDVEAVVHREDGRVADEGRHGVT